MKTLFLVLFLSQIGSAKSIEIAAKCIWSGGEIIVTPTVDSKQTVYEGDYYGLKLKLTDLHSWESVGEIKEENGQVFKAKCKLKRF